MPMGASATLDRVRRSTADQVTDHSAVPEPSVGGPSGTRMVDRTQTMCAGESPAAETGTAGASGIVEGQCLLRRSVGWVDPVEQRAHRLTGVHP